MRDRNREQGSQTLEVTLVGIPLIFLLFSTANMCFAMLTLHTLQEAVEQGARYVVTHGSTCSSGGNTCAVKVKDIAGVISASAPGINASNLNVTLIPDSGTTNQISCNPVTTCLSNATVWPTSTGSDNSPGKDIIITADCNVTAPMFMFWAGSGSTKASATSFHAYSRQRLMF